MTEFNIQYLLFCVSLYLFLEQIQCLINILVSVDAFGKSIEYLFFRLIKNSLTPLIVVMQPILQEIRLEACFL